MVVGKEAVLSLLNTVSSLKFRRSAACTVLLHARLYRKQLDSKHALLMQADAGAKAKEGVFALLWNRGSEHFQVLLGLVPLLHIDAWLPLCNPGMGMCRRRHIARRPTCMAPP